jgi:hypothetical protein
MKNKKRRRIKRDGKKIGRQERTGKTEKDKYVCISTCAPIFIYTSIYMRVYIYIYIYIYIYSCVEYLCVCVCLCVCGGGGGGWRTRAREYACGVPVCIHTFIEARNKIKDRSLG